MSDLLAKPAAPTSNPPPTQPPADAPSAADATRLVEHGGRRPSVSRGLEPTRFGDWEKDGRCIDF